jgi:hypothetical protein
MVLTTNLFYEFLIGLCCFWFGFPFEFSFMIKTLIKCIILWTYIGFVYRFSVVGGVHNV